MSATDAVLDFFILVVVALLPALIYLTWIRDTERFRESWGILVRGFLYGALIATFIAAILEGIIVAAGTAVSQAYPGPEFLFLNGNSTAGVFFLVLVIAPLIEEALKAYGVVNWSSSIRVLADGPVLGASVGLGFGFLETLLYGLGAFLVGGLVAGIALILLRSVSAVVLHGSTTAMFGYGYAQSKLLGRAGAVGRYYLLAVTMHAGFNALASLAVIVAILGFAGPYVTVASLLALALVVAYAFGAIEHVRGVIEQADFPGASAAHPRFRPPPARARNAPGAPRSR